MRRLRCVVHSAASCLPTGTIASQQGHINADCTGFGCVVPHLQCMWQHLHLRECCVVVGI